MDCCPPGYSLWYSPDKNTGVDCHSLLQGIFPTQGSNPGLLHFRWIQVPEPPRKQASADKCLFSSCSCDKCPQGGSTSSCPIVLRASTRASGHGASWVGVTVEEASTSSETSSLITFSLLALRAQTNTAPDKLSGCCSVWGEWLWESRPKLETPPPGHVETRDTLKLFQPRKCTILRLGVGVGRSSPWRHPESYWAVRIWGDICWHLFPIALVQPWDWSMRGFQVSDKSRGPQCLSGTQSTLLFIFLIWIFILPIIDLGGCIFWGVQPGDSIVDVLMTVPMWLFSHMDQCTLLNGVPSAGRRLLLIIDFQYIWVYMLVPTSCIILAPMFPLWKPLVFVFVFSFFLSLCVCFPFWKCIHPMKFSV